MTRHVDAYYGWHASKGDTMAEQDLTNLGDSIIIREQQPVRKYGWREKVTFDCGDVVRTKQSFRDECDINLIVKRHASDGLLAHLNPRLPKYGDFSASIELRDAMELVTEAQKGFAQIPAEVRAMCNNDPALFLNMVNDPNHIEALAEAGLPMAEGWEPTPAEQEQAAVEVEKTQDPSGGTE